MYGVIVFFIGVAIAQGIKTLQALLKEEENWQKRIYNAIFSLGKSGGMPSGHTLSLSSLATYLGLEYGFTSPYFAIAVGFTWWFMYDAVKARRSIGEQAKAINWLLDDIGEGENQIRLIEGHTMPEVLVGLLLGIISGSISFLLL
ncbi:divergent PAP2 family protein [Candidatus Saccharibacteria bacterium]|nr:divergent PAP2 family protein [Candidatus Saccharibacteria bacterium]